MTTSLRIPATATGCQPGTLKGRCLRVCVSLACSVGLAAYLLFWFFEGLSPRMDSIARWETRRKSAAQTHKEQCAVTGTLLCLKDLPSS